MSVRSCMKTNPLGEEDLETFQETFIKSQDANKAIDVVIKQIKADYRLLAKSVRESGGVLPKLRTEQVKAEKKKKPTKKEKVDKLVEQDVARREDLVVPLTAEEKLDDEVGILTNRQLEQLDGWSRAGIDEDVIDYAELNPDVLELAETIDNANPDLSFAEAAYEAVKQSREGTKEAVDLDYKAENPSTRDEILSEFKEAFNTDFTSGNVTVHDTASDLNPSQLASRSPFVTAWVTPAGRIHIIADRVEKGEGVSLLMHEKGVHELLRITPEYKRVLRNIERILADSNNFDYESVKTARKRAEDAYSRTTNKEGFDLQEETVAYLIQSKTRDVGFVKSIMRTLQQAFRRIMGDPDANMNVTSMVMLVTSMIQEQAAVQTAKEAKETSKETEAEAEAARLASMFDDSVDSTESEGRYDTSTNPNMATEEQAKMKEAVDTDIDSSVHAPYQGTVANDPRSFFQRVWDVSQTEGYIAATKASARYITDTPLKAWIPQSHLLRQAEELGLVNAANLESITDKTRQEAQQNIDYAINNVVKPARDLSQSNRTEYLKVVQMLHDATYNNKDMKKTSRFNSLSPEAQNVYKEVEKHYKKQGQLMLESMATALDTDGLSSENKAELQKYIDTFKYTLNNTIYFPMQRFGSRRITADNRVKGRHVEFMDNTSEIIEAKKELMKMGYAEGDITISKVESLDKDAREVMDRDVFDKAQSIISNMEGNEKAQEALWKTFMAMAPSNKLKDRMSTRRFVKGASNRMVEGLNKSTSLFFETSQRRHSPERSELIRELETSLKALPQITTEDIRKHKEAEEVLSEIKDREDMSGQTRAKWSSNLSKANFFIHLGFNMSSAIINLTQNAIVGVPVLAAKHGAVRSAKALGAEFSNAVKILSGNNPYTGEELMAFRELESRGTINLTQAQMLQDISESDRNMIKDGLGENVMAASAFMFHKAEVANRITAAMSSYKLNIDAGKSHQEAIEAAVNDTREIHFDYSEEGKSRIQRGDIGGVALAFKSYPIQMAWYMASNIKKSMPFTTGTTAEKKAARTKIVGTLLMTQLFAGAMGLPTSSIFHMIADMIMDDEDDAHEMFKEFMRDSFGDELGDALRMGVIGQMTGVNLSSRTSLDQMFFRIPQGEAKAEDWKRSLMEAAVGPIGARISTIPKGVDLMLEGKALAGMEAFMPAIYTNLSRATRWGAEGQAHNAYDDLVEKDFNTYDAILKGVGFSSSEYQDTSEDLWIGKRLDRTVSRKKRVALRDMAIAVIQGDSSDRRSARKAIREWNRANPMDKISQSSIKRRVRDLRKKLRGDE